MNHALSNRPKSGATLRVWEIADSLTDAQGSLATRKQVIDAYVAEGGNPNTGSTQYQYWKTARNAPADPAPANAPQELSEGDVLRLTVAPDGRLVLPPAVLAALDLPRGGTLAARLEGDELRLSEPVAALRRVQARLTPLRERAEQQGQRISDELLRERAAETRSGR